MEGRTRREVLAVITAATAAQGLQAQDHQTMPGMVQIAAGAYKAKVLTAAEMTWLNPLVDAIIPRTDTPGAADAGVPAFIDRRLATNLALAAQMRKGMVLTEAESMRRFQRKFLELTAPQVTDLLTQMAAAPDTEAGKFFQTIKEMTIDGYYTSQEGLVQELGWHGNTYLKEFPGCTHPEHQV